MSYGDAMTKRGVTELEDGISSGNAQDMNKGDHVTWKSGMHRKQSVYLSPIERVLTLPAAQAGRGDLQRRGLNSHGNWQRVGQHPPKSGLNERAITIIGHIPIAVKFNMTQRMTKGLMHMRNVNAQGEREITPKARATDGTTIVVDGHRIGIGIILITIGQKSTDQRRETPLRRNAKRLLVDRMRRLEGARPQSARARTSIFIDPVLQQAKGAVETVMKLRTITEGKKRLANLTEMAMEIKESTASFGRGSLCAVIEDLSMRPATRYRQGASSSTS